MNSMGSAVEHGSGPSGFPVVWDDPADATRTWFWDATHFPFPLAALSIDLTNLALEAWNRLSGKSPEEATRGRFANGFFYFMWQPPEKDEGERKKQETRNTPAWKQAAERNAPRLTEHWALDVRPRIEALCTSLKDPDFEAMSLKELAGQLRRHFEASAEAFGLTQFAMNALFTALDPFVEWCKARWGEEAEPLTGTMLDGVPNETRASETALFRIAQLIARNLAVLKAIEHNDLGGLSSLALDSDAARSGGVSQDAARVLAAVEQFLDQYGWRAEIWFDLSKPTWREDPRPVMELLRLYALDPRTNPTMAARRASERRRRLVRRVERELATDAGKLDAFRRVYRTALPYVTVREGRALWQLTSTGVLRRPVLALGRKLAQAGSLRDETDVVHLGLAELEALGARPESGRSRFANSAVADLAAARRKEHERWWQVVPPAVIGRMDPAAKDLIVHFSGVAGLEGDSKASKRVLKGRPASRGIVTGKARVITELTQAATFERGEILVCRTTSPAWTPLVARALAVVTDSGGPLAHTAIVAREFGIPCVLAVGDATRRLRDGMTVTVDGAQGLVRIE